MHKNLHNIMILQSLHIPGFIGPSSGSQQLYKPRTKTSLPPQKFAAVL